MTIPTNRVQQLGKIPFFHYRPSSCYSRLTLCFVPGFRSSFMSSRKSDHIYHWAQRHQFGFLTWDHTEETSIQDWCQQGRDIINTQLLQQQEILFVGASLGTWLSLKIAHELIKENSKQVMGLIGIGGAVDVTERWLREVDTVNKNGMWRRPSNYSDDGFYDIPVSFLTASHSALLFNDDDKDKIDLLPYPVHLMHGRLDDDVPLEHVNQLTDWIQKRSTFPVHLHLVQDGDHQLSRPQDLSLLDILLTTCTAETSLGNSATMGK